MHSQLKSELGRLQTETLTLRAKNKELCCSLEEVRQRHRKTRTALLALRGRTANEKKQQEREEVSSVSLQPAQTEKGCPSVEEPVTHSDNGGRVKQLRAELRRKVRTLHM